MPPKKTPTQPTLADLMTKVEMLEAQHESIKRKLFVMSLFNYLKLALILIPVVLGLIYLPPFIREVVDIYQSFLGLGTGAQENSIQDILSTIPEDQLKNILQLIQ